jgi:hypothetical protein
VLDVDEGKGRKNKLWKTMTVDMMRAVRADGALLRKYIKIKPTWGD